MLQGGGAEWSALPGRAILACDTRMVASPAGARIGSRVHAVTVAFDRAAGAPERTAAARADGSAVADVSAAATVGWIVLRIDAPGAARDASPQARGSALTGG